MNEERTTCTVRDGRFVEPCVTLEQATDNNMGSFSKMKGIFCTTYTNMKTRKPARTFYGVKTKQFANGIAFNNCPFCGSDISAPFMQEDEPEAAR